MRCAHCGWKDCKLDGGACLTLEYTCPVCKVPVLHKDASWDAGKPMHQLCLTALKEVQADQPQGELIDSYVKGALVSIEIPIPLLLTVDMDRMSLADQYENIFTDLILAYRENPPSYNWATETLDVSEAEKMAQKLLNDRLHQMKESMKAMDKKLKAGKK